MSTDCANHDLPLPAGAADAALPIATRILVYLTTAPFRPAPWMAPEIVARLAALAQAGWMLRAAPPRNFLLWRHGRTLTSTRAPLMVLPLDFGRLGLQGRTIFLATEIVRAEDRVAGRPFDAGPETEEKIKALCSTTAVRLGVTVDTSEPVYRRALRDLEARV